MKRSENTFNDNNNITSYIRMVFYPYSFYLRNENRASIHYCCLSHRHRHTHIHKTEKQRQKFAVNWHVFVLAASHYNFTYDSSQTHTHTHARAPIDRINSMIESNLMFYWCYFYWIRCIRERKRERRKERWRLSTLGAICMYTCVHMRASEIVRVLEFYCLKSEKSLYIIVSCAERELAIVQPLSLFHSCPVSIFIISFVRLMKHHYFFLV